MRHARTADRFAMFVGLAAATFLMAEEVSGVGIIIDNPPEGTGGVWDCTVIGGHTDGFSPNSLVYGRTYKKVGEDWLPMWPQAAPPFGPFWMTTTDQNGSWSTTPDREWETATKYWHDSNPNDQIDEYLWYESGKYKVKAHVTDDVSMVEDWVENTWTIP